jgi:hypothetical protein
MKVLNFYHIGKSIPDNAVYIGRRNNKFNLQESKFANPFPITEEYSRQEVIDKYKTWLWNQIKQGLITKEDILSLDGKDLVCYCSPHSCHGDVLLKAIEYFRAKDIKITWSRKIGYQVNSKTDKRFSPFYCFLSDGKSIEDHYQTTVKGYSSFSEGKGKPPLDTTKDMFTEYLKLWREWSVDKDDLLLDLFNKVKENNYILGDFFATTEVNQAHALSVILNEKYLGYKRVIVAGSRNITDYCFIKEILDKCNFKFSTIISGTANGVDSLGEKYAKENNISIERFPAQWDKLGKSAGYIRNSLMAENADCLVCIWDGKSKGTKHMFDLAKKHKLQINMTIKNEEI